MAQNVSMSCFDADGGSKRHSAAMSDASSHREHNATHSSSSSERGKPGMILHHEASAMLSESEWASDDEVMCEMKLSFEEIGKKGWMLWSC